MLQQLLKINPSSYSYEWFETDAAGNITATTSDTDLTLGNLSISGTKYYILRTTSNGCEMILQWYL